VLRILPVVTVLALVAPALAQASPSPPFKQCPAIGDDTSCAVLIEVHADGSTTSYVDSSQGQVDGSDDVLVGVQNDSSTTVPRIPLTGSGIFAFDDDGLCTLANAPPVCPFGPTTYEGPNTSFSVTDENNGSVLFTNGLAPGASTYFSLEGTATSVAPPPPGIELGVLDLNAYCRSIGYANAALSKPQQGPHYAYDNWVCVAANGSAALIDLQNACAATYGQRPILAQPTDPDDAYSWRCYQRPTVSIASLTPGNGSVTVSWQPTGAAASGVISSYVVTVKPARNDRVPAPAVSTPPALTVGATNSSATISGLVADCHQRYTVSVTPETSAGASPAAMSSVFRPSGIVKPGTRPPYVVVLLDGIGSQQAGFRMDPYHPTNPGGPASYCPENVSATGKVIHNDFLGRHPAHATGPWEFFAKWNYFDPKDGSDPRARSNSTPRDLRTRALTHSFMLDAIAATGAMIFPYSYWGATLNGHRGSGLKFVYNAYTDCNSTPVPVAAFCSSNPDAGGSPDPAHNDHSNAKHSFSVDEAEDRLKTEVDSIERVWPNEAIVIIGHSQGGLIAFETWRKHMLPGAVSHLFSLDSPINGACGGGFAGIHVTPCLGPPGYPAFDLDDPFARWARDRDYLGQDGGRDPVFRFIGTRGDEVRVSALGNTPGYGTKGETLQHQLLVTGPCRRGNRSGCPSPPDHVSECPVPEGHVTRRHRWIYDDGHFIEKFCPGNIAYVNKVLRLPY
jgi:hypothetical protein